MSNNLVSTIIISSFSVFMLLSSTGCSLNNKQVENTVYKFAYDVSMEDPNIFECEVKHGERVCHDKSIKIDGMGFPEEGSGRCISVQKEGNVSIAYWNATEWKKLSEGNISPDQIKGTSLTYEPSLDGEEVIGMYHNGSNISYCRTDTTWERRCFDLSKVVEGINEGKNEDQIFKEMPTLSRKRIDEKEVKKYLDLIERVRSKYLMDVNSNSNIKTLENMDSQKQNSIEVTREIADLGNDVYQVYLRVNLGDIKGLNNFIITEYCPRGWEILEASNDGLYGDEFRARYNIINWVELEGFDNSGLLKAKDKVVSYRIRKNNKKYNDNDFSGDWISVHPVTDETFQGEIKNK